MSASETVVLVHGLGRSPLSMALLHLDLRRAGYRVVNWGYRSFRRPIAAHAARLAERVAQLDADPQVTAIHFVTHSLGGILVRHVLCTTRPARLGRVVMLARPNRGSDVARRLGPWLGRLVRPLPELSSDPDSFVCRQDVPHDCTIGIIAALRDGKVRIEDTHLPGEADHLVVPGRHTFIMNRGDVRRQVLAFLREGRFDRTP